MKDFQVEKMPVSEMAKKEKGGIEFNASAGGGFHSSLSHHPAVKRKRGAHKNSSGKNDPKKGGNRGSPALPRSCLAHTAILNVAGPQFKEKKKKN